MKKQNKKKSPKKLKKNISSPIKAFNIKDMKVFSENIISQNFDLLSSKNQTRNNYTVSQLSQQMQLKFLQNKILLINLTSCITELAKILVNAGFNIYIHDKEIISQTDATNNIFLSIDDCGQPRVEILYKKLILVNSTVSVIKLKDITKVKDYKVAIVGFTDFETLMEYEEYFNRKGIIYLCINTSGLYSFCYHNLCSRIVDNFCDEKNKKIVLAQNLNSNNFLKKEETFLEKGKILEDNDGIIAAVFLLEIYYRKNIDKKIMKKVLKDELSNDNKFIKKMYFIENYLKNTRKDDILNNEYFENSIRNLIINFNRELNPVCSTMAKKVFEILFIFFRDKIFPEEIMITYNSDSLQEFKYDGFF